MKKKVSFQLLVELRGGVCREKIYFLVREKNEIEKNESKPADGVVEHS